MLTRTLLAGLLLSLMTTGASAQLFTPIPGDPEQSTLENAGKLSGDRRFLRQNVRRGDFVGRTDDASQGFVGQAQGQTTGRVQTATSTLREEPAPPVNTPRTPSSANGIYEPRLTIGFEADPPSAPEQEQQIQSTVSRALALRFHSQIEVTLSAGTATLRGEVESEAAKKLASLLVQFEPGVESVRNELRVPGPPALPPPPQAR